MPSAFFDVAQERSSPFLSLMPHPTSLEENKIVMKRFASSSSPLLPVLFAALFAMVPVTSTMAGIVLSSNMDNFQTHHFGIGDTQWAAAPFRTTSLLKTITGVDANFFIYNGNYDGGNMAIDIWTSKAGNARPDSRLVNIYNSEFQGSVLISGLSVALNPDTQYFVVARGDGFNGVDQGGDLTPGYLDWGTESGNDQSGDGFVSGLFFSLNGGRSWLNFGYFGTPMMTVFASSSTSSVPEIDPATGSSALSLVAGVLAMIEQRRRRATLVA